MDHFQGFTEKSTLHKPSKEPQKTTEELVPIVVAALAGAMDSRELAPATGFPPAAVGNALRLASNYGLVSKVPPFDKRVMTWERTKGKAYTTALQAATLTVRFFPFRELTPTGASTYGAGAIGWRVAGTLRMRFGRSTSRTKLRRNRMMISILCSDSHRPWCRPIRLPAVT